ncbi:hypothetical protein [Deinococcus alpinitundrae]|uniref:hypothetical protein n=1 Tax=Deinococcus alpinitundrae TaxID=468913 RepID=UPI00137A49E2|nr:hypothetical protein [Deinococcus alpinitundrae]
MTVAPHGTSSDQQAQYQIIDDQSGLKYLAERGTREGGPEGIYQYMVRSRDPR